MAKRKNNPTKIEQETISPINKILTTKYRLKFKNKSQKDYSDLITNHEIVLSAGPAGVGKSYVAIARAIELLQNKTNKFEKMLILKPAVEADEKHGFLPGDMREKMEPYVSSSMDIVDKIMGEKNRLKLEEAGIIKVEALAYIRGKSIDNAILIMEEAQNMSPNQVKTLLTRIGENSKFIVSGDLDQSDRYKDVTESGLYDAVNRHRHLDEIGYYEFGVEDIVRNPIITKILRNYNNTSSVDGMLPSKIIPLPPPPPPPRRLRQDGSLVKKSKRVRNLTTRWKVIIRWVKRKLKK